MKKRLTILTALAAATIFTGCALREFVRARALISKCGFELESVDLKLLDFAPAITFDNSGKKFSVAQPSVTELLPLLMEIKNRKFSLDFEKLDVTAHVKVHNPNNYDASLDKMELDAFLDDMLLARIEHQEFDEIPAMGSKVVLLNVRFPTTVVLRKVLDAQEMTLKGKAWLRLKMGNTMSASVSLPVTVKRPVPREKIKKAVKKEQGRIVRELLKVLETGDLLDKARGLFK